MAEQNVAPSGAQPAAAPQTSPNVASATTGVQSDTGAGATQEQAATGVEQQLTQEQIDRLLTSNKDVQARVYQAAQSMKDRELYQERLRQQQQQQAAKIAKMDDEQYGQFRRSVEARSADLTNTTAGVMTRLLSEMQDKALGQISNKVVREEMLKKSQEFQTFPEFMAACIKAEAEYKADQTMTKREKEIRDAVQKEVQAEQADQLYPQLGRGAPRARTSGLHGQSAIAAGYKAALEKSRKG